MTKEYLDGLVEARQKAWHEGQAILDAAHAEGREMTGEEKQAWEAINADLDAKDAEIRSVLDRIEADKAADERRERIAHLIVPGRKPESEDGGEPSIRALLTGETRAVEFPVDAALAKELMERRDITTNAASAGKTVPTTLVARLYEELVRNTNIFGVSTIITTASGEPLDFPVVKAADGTEAKVAAADASLPVTEGGGLPEVSPVFDKVTITPSKYGVYLQITSELAQDTVVDVEGYVARSSANGIRNNAGKDLAATLIAGAGDSGQTYANFAAISTNTSGAATDALTDIVYSLNPEYRARASWFTSDAFIKAVRKIKDADSRPVWQPSLVAGQPDTLMGFPVVEDVNVPTSGAGAKVVVFGDLSAHTIRQVGSLRYDVSSDYAFINDMVTYRVIWRGGSAVLDTQALKWADIAA